MQRNSINPLVAIADKVQLHLNNLRYITKTIIYIYTHSILCIYLCILYIIIYVRFIND
jgi:hypothetical protein